MRRHEHFESSVPKERDPTLFLNWELSTDITQVSDYVQKLEDQLTQYGWPQADDWKGKTLRQLLDKVFPFQGVHC